MFDAKFVSGLIVATGLAVASPATLAENENYFGINFASVKHTDDFTPGRELSLPVLYGRVGTRFDENFSVEGRLGIGGSDTFDGDDFGESHTLVLSDFVGGFIRRGVQAGEDFYPYLIVGYTRITLEDEVYDRGDEVLEENSRSGFSYGIGANIKMSERLSGNIEYMNYYNYNEDEDKIGEELKGVAIGITRSF